jgi:hypothetical protein
MRDCDPKVACFHEDVEGTLWLKERLVVVKRNALKKKILDEVHTSRYSIYPGSTMMYHDLGQQFWWTSVTPGFNIRTRCSSYVCTGSTCHTYGHNVNTENQCLYYVNIITQNIVFTRRLGRFS